MDSAYPHAWLSLDKSDSDASRFLVYVISAFETLIPNIGVGLVDRLQSPQPPLYEFILTALINNILVSISQLLVDMLI